MQSNGFCRENRVCVRNKASDRVISTDIDCCNRNLAINFWCILILGENSFKRDRRNPGIESLNIDYVSVGRVLEVQDFFFFFFFFCKYSNYYFYTNTMHPKSSNQEYLGGNLSPEIKKINKNYRFFLSFFAIFHLISTQSS